MRSKILNFLSEICHFCTGRPRCHFGAKFHTIVRTIVRYVHDLFRNFFEKFSKKIMLPKITGAYEPGLQYEFPNYLYIPTEVTIAMHGTCLKLQLCHLDERAHMLYEKTHQVPTEMSRVRQFPSPASFLVAGKAPLLVRPPPTSSLCIASW